MGPVYFYTDETGNKSGGRYFIIAGVALDADLNATRRQLITLEAMKGGIGRHDWHDTKEPRVRCRYLCGALVIPTLEGHLFWTRFEGRTDYWRCTVEALQLAMRHYGRDKRCVVAHEGFTVGSRDKLQNELLGDFEVRRGNFREPLIRLADRLAGGLGVNYYADIAQASRYRCQFDAVLELRS